MIFSHALKRINLRYYLATIFGRITLTIRWLSAHEKSVERNKSHALSRSNKIVEE